MLVEWLGEESDESSRGNGKGGTDHRGGGAEGPGRVTRGDRDKAVDAGPATVFQFTLIDFFTEIPVLYALQRV